MTASELRAAADRLQEMHGRFAPLFGRTEAREHSWTYLHGLLNSSERKCAQPIALNFAPQAQRKEVLALQRFITNSPWQSLAVMQEIQAVFREELVPSTSQWDLGTVGIVDESGFPKRGSESVGVQRQWCGRLGKEENCQVGVFLVGLTPGGSALLDHQLYLPRRWADDTERRTKTHVPDEIEFRTKPEIATELLRRTRAHGVVSLDWIVADEGYGNNGAFLNDLDDHEQRYLVEVPCTSTVWTQDPATQVLPGCRRPVRDSVRDVRAVANDLEADAWQVIRLRQGAKGPLAFEFAFVRTWAMRHRQPGPPVWLVIRRSLEPEPEIKYYVSNADAETPHEILAQVTGVRWPVEDYFADGKSDLGLDDYQGRAWASWHHHVSLVALAHLYVTLTRRDLQADEPELTLDMALRLLKSTLPRPKLEPEDAIEIVQYHLTYNRIARESHHRSWLKRHPDVPLNK